jgi:hypothetical protein
VAVASGSGGPVAPKSGGGGRVGGAGGGGWVWTAGRWAAVARGDRATCGGRLAQGRPASAKRQAAGARGSVELGGGGRGGRVIVRGDAG